MTRASHWDSSLALAARGYLYISSECERNDTDVFAGRLMLQRTVFMKGAEAARFFYQNDQLMRSTAAPRRMRKTLVGDDGVQTLDNEAHHRRKSMFMELMSPDRVKRLQSWYRQAWMEALPFWEDCGRIILLPELERLLFRAACSWCGVPVPRRDINRLSRQTALLISGGGSLGLDFLRARLARLRLQKWIGELIEEHRFVEECTGQRTPLDIITRYRNPDTEQVLSPRVAAVEVLNLIRPIVAVARYIVFSMHAWLVHLREEDRHRLANGDAIFRQSFLQEVRRFYPFFPFIAARVRSSFSWSGVQFPQGARVVLDLYGTNHDAHTWPEPHTFNPSRFIDHELKPFSFIPQGGGDPHQGHRCPGEEITLALMEQSIDMLLNLLQYHIPEQDLHIDLRRMPTAPRSGFILENVRSVESVG